MINIAVIMGRLTADPELRQTQDGVPVLSFTVVVERRYADQNGERRADFIHCVAWRHTAEFISKYFFKGRRIAVEGALQSRNYVDKMGNNRSVLELIVENVSFCESRPDSGSGGRGGSDRLARSTTDAAQNSSNREASFSVGNLDDMSDFEELGSGSDDSELPF